MPIGVIAASLSIVVGGLLGARVGNRIPEEFKEKLYLVFGVCSMGMGVSNIILLANMPAVILALIVGTCLGMAVRLGQRIEGAGRRLQGVIDRLAPTGAAAGGDAEKTGLLVTALVLFCASGTGIYGALISGMSGDHSILIAKAMLDLPTSMIFACSLGAVVSIVAVPQLAIFLALFACARLIYPLTTPAMIADFKACGGFIMLATGFRIVRLKQFPIADMIPAMVLVMPLSWLWSACVLPLLGG